MLILIFIYGPDELRKPVNRFTFDFTGWSLVFGVAMPTAAHAWWVHMTVGKIDWLVIILVAELCMIAMMVTMFAVWLWTLPPYRRKV